MGENPTPDLKQSVARYYGRLYRSALFMCGDPWQAEDIVQETFLAANRAWDSFRGDASPYTWLYRIMLNTFRRKLRSDRKMLSLTELGADARDGEPRGEDLVESPGPLPQQEIEQGEQARLVRGAIDSLPPHHREVLVLRFLEEKSYEEIAQTLECSIGTVKSRLHYALKRIGDALRAMGVRPEPEIPGPSAGLSGQTL
jgi:RNA polymerase sigma-70 factor (ECF subfamily)